MRQGEMGDATTLGGGSTDLHVGGTVLAITLFLIYSITGLRIGDTDTSVMLSNSSRARLN